MKRPQIIILTDRGNLKAIRLTSNRSEHSDGSVHSKTENTSHTQKARKEPHINYGAASNHEMPRLEILEELSFVLPHQHFVEQVSDLAGSFSTVESSSSGSPNGAPRRSGSSTSEVHWKIEADRRAVEDLADAILRILDREKPDSWSLAAPKDIHSMLLARIPGSFMSQLLEVLPLDLVHIEHSRMLSHFWEA